MRLSEPIEKPGIFWLPDDPKDQVPGILRISESGEATVEVFRYCDPLGYVSKKRSLGYPPTHGEDPKIRRILGIIKSELITLDGCSYKNYNASLTGGISTSTVRAEYAFFGANYDAEEEVTFSKLTFSVEGLDEWLSITGINVKPNWNENGASASIHFKRPEEIPVNLPDGVELRFIFLSNTSRNDITELRISQKAYISLKSKELRPVEGFLDLVSKLQDFLCFAIDRAISINTIIGYSCVRTTEIKGETCEIGISIYRRSKPYADEKSKIYSPDMLLHYKYVACQIEDILNKWLENYEILEPAFNLYFATKSNVKGYLENRFLSLAHAVEVLHRRTSQDLEMPKEEFEDLVDTILKAIPQDRKDWVAGKLKYGNELSFRKRTKQMIEPFEHLLGNQRKRRSFIDKVVDTRNYLTHYNSELATKAAHWEALWKLYRKLEALFQLHLLRLIGIDLDSIRSIVNENRALGEKLELEHQE